MKFFEDLCENSGETIRIFSEDIFQEILELKFAEILEVKFSRKPEQTLGDIYTCISSVVYIDETFREFLEESSGAFLKECLEVSLE